MVKDFFQFYIKLTSNIDNKSTWGSALCSVKVVNDKVIAFNKWNKVSVQRFLTINDFFSHSFSTKYLLCYMGVLWKPRSLIFSRALYFMYDLNHWLVVIKNTFSSLNYFKSQYT